MTRRIFTIVSIILTIGIFNFFCSGQNDEKSLKTDVDQQALIANLEETIPQIMESTMIPGLSIAVIRDGSLLWSKGFGVKNNESKEPVTNETIVRLQNILDSYS